MRPRSTRTAPRASLPPEPELWPSTHDANSSSYSPTIKRSATCPARAVGPHRRVESIEGNRDLGAEGPQAGGRLDCQPHGRVHGNREGDDVGTLEPVVVPFLHCQVETFDLVTIPEQSRSRRGEMQRLMPEFISGYQKDLHQRDLKESRGNLTPLNARPGLASSR